MCFFCGTFLVLLNAQEFTAVIDRYFENFVEEGELLQQDVEWEITSQHISSTSHINHIYFNQTLHGIQILYTDSSIHLYPNGKELASNNKFIKGCSNRSIGRSTPSLKAKKVVELVADQLNYTLTEPLKVLKKKQGVQNETLFSNGGISKSDIPVKLKYWRNEDDKLVLVWELSILENSMEHSWNVLADASTGTIINKIDTIINCTLENNAGKEKSLNYNRNLYDIPDYNNLNNSIARCENCYEVIPMPFKSPYFGERIIEINPSNFLASPYGWHDTNGLPGADYYTTKGNNIDAFIGNSDNNGYQPDGGETLDFTNYLFDEEFSPLIRYEDASLTNLFYWGNIVHDVIYQYGFDEASGNFQNNNYENGGLGFDSVLIYGQDEVDLCNASFHPTPDGNQPFISMNACNNKDGAFDNEVLIHEYSHGISIRLTGGSFSGNCFYNKEALGEGISDWYGMMLTNLTGDNGSYPRGFATYLFDQGPDGEGVRLYKYSTDMEINPQTYNSIIEEPGLHAVGSVWATILWELTWRLVDEYGFDEDIYNFTGDINKDAGNIMALAIVTEALKIQPCYPGFIDGRDAILDANDAIYGAGYNCVLWDAFAKRGLGFSAIQGSPFVVIDGEEAFDSPPSRAVFTSFQDTICSNANKFTELKGGIPYGGVYNGPGVTDDGNGETYSFDPLVAGLGTHTITYEVQDTFCTVASVSEDTIEVLVDVIEPEIICSEDITVTIPLERTFYSIIDYTRYVHTEDNCNAEPVITQRPVAGTPAGEGKVIIKMLSTDNAGNKSRCSFILTVEKEVGEIKEKFGVSPNPAKEEIFLFSNIDIGILSASIYDINGRIVRVKRFDDFGYENKLSLEQLDAGMYFLKIKSDSFNLFKRIIKE